ncbi:MAG: hypothetical protein ACE5FI_12490, partial [Anaerolineales bacterium]
MAKAPNEPAPPAGVIESLSAGFETVAAHAGLMLLPLLLDLFLWLGPHLSIYPLTVKFSNLIDEELPLSAAAAETRRALTESLEQAGEQLNVFAFVSTAPIGIPSLIAGKAPMDAPIGEPTVWAVTGELQLLTFALGFTLIGLLLGAVYFSFIA